MLDEKKQAVNIGVGAGLGLQLLGIALMVAGQNMLIVMPVLLASIGLFAFGCWSYAAGKGYPGVLGLLGVFFGLIGLIILVALPDKHKDGRRRDLQVVAPYPQPGGSQAGYGQPGGYLGYPQEQPASFYESSPQGASYDTPPSSPGYLSDAAGGGTGAARARARYKAATAGDPVGAAPPAVGADAYFEPILPAPQASRPTSPRPVRPPRNRPQIQHWSVFPPA